MADKWDRWSKKETQTLKSKWPNHTAEEIANRLPGRTKEAVESKAQRLDEKGELPDKNRSNSYSNTSHSTSQKQVEKGGSRVKTVSGQIVDVKRETPRGMEASNGIGVKIDGEWYYDTYSPSRFEDNSYGIAFSEQGFTVRGARLSGADYTVENSGSGRSYNRLQSYGIVQKGQATEISQIENWDRKGDLQWANPHPTDTSKYGKPSNRGFVNVLGPLDDGKWAVTKSRGVFEDGEWVDKEKEFEKYDTEEQAISEAKEYMRDHPKGGMIEKSDENIENWRELKPGVNVEMVWKHEDTGESVAVRELGNGNYKLITPKYEPQYFGDRERVREEAIEYMEENPQGSDSTYEERTTKGASKQDRVRANKGR